MTSSDFENARAKFKWQMSSIAIALFLAITFLISRPQVRAFFRPHDHLALAFMFLVLIAYAAIFMGLGRVLARRHRLVCPACGNSLLQVLRTIQKNNKCPACHSEVFHGS